MTDTTFDFTTKENITGFDFQPPHQTDGSSNQNSKATWTETVSNFQKEIRRAQSAGDNGALQKLKAFGMRLLNALWGYTKSAIEIAVHKFFVELCVMIIVGLANIMKGKQRNPVDMTTPGLFYAANGGMPGMPSMASQPQQPAFSDPFGGFGSKW